MTSLWQATAAARTPRPPLVTDLDADVAIVGAGYSGLWTAYYLKRRDPRMRIAVIERDYAGFGASGRNGGWCVGEFAAPIGKLVAAGGREQAVGLLRAVADSVDEVERVCNEHRLECDFAKGGALYLARSPAQLARQRTRVAEMHQVGFNDADIRMLDDSQARSMLNATRVVGGLYAAHGAALHPLRLAQGLADIVVDLGVDLYEATAALDVQPRRVTTAQGTIRADVVVLATEAYTVQLPGRRRDLVPLYSLMVATEPLGPDIWAELGLGKRQTFADGRHLVVYGQRTADDRIAFGGRGAPYGFGSRIDSALEHQARVHDGIIATLRRLSPVLADVAIDYRWGGVLGVPRDWFPSVNFDRASGWATLGGYVGEGVAASNLAGRTLADLIAGDATDRTRYPWVGHHSRRWEPEPLRWASITGAVNVVTMADRLEASTGKQSRLAAAMNQIIR